MIITRPLLMRDLQRFLRDVRGEDLKELAELNGEDFYNLPASWVIAGTKAIIHKETGRVLGIGGIELSSRFYATVWALLTCQVEKHPIEFLRWSKKYLRDMILTRYEEVGNYVHKDNKLHIAWLNWLEAEWLPHDNTSRRAFILRRKEE